MQTEFYKAFLTFIEQNFPKAYASFGENKPYELLFSPTIVELDNQVFENIKEFIEETFEVAHSSSYAKAIEQMLPVVGRFQPANYSVFMSYDFHITKDGPKIIEINTNASLASFSALLTEYRSQQIEDRYLKCDFLNDCKKMIFEEHRLCGKNTPPKIVITDFEPEKQKAYSEFIFYRELFRSWGLICEIEDTVDLKFDENAKTLKGKYSQGYDFVYNRNTDFYFESAECECLKNAYLSKQITITPNPREYALLADKERLLQLSDQQFLSSIGVSESTQRLFLKIIPQIFPISRFNLDTPKKDREKYFFKPRRSFGSKAVYNGKRLSNKVYAEILSKDYLVQEIVEPPTHRVTIDSNELEFKWDLRVYVYKNQPTHMVARLYQGQTTNTQTLGGGLAPIRLI